MISAGAEAALFKVFRPRVIPPIAPKWTDPGKLHMNKVLVLGGSGFVGKAICRELIKIGADVYSINRSGMPRGCPADLETSVKWIKGNALDPQTYNQLSDIDTLIHSIGIISEPKPQANQNFPVTFESEIRDTLKVALEASKSFGAPLQRIGYISAADFGAVSNLLLPRYMKAKREAESILHEFSSEHVPSVIARPGFMYGPDRFSTVPFSYAYSLATLFSAGMLPKALDVTKVAASLITALADENLSGTRILEVSDLQL